MMKGFRILIIIGWIAILGQKLHAQGENNNWAFGYSGGGLDFNSGIPVFFSTNMHSKEGCATVSDAFGHLLFYTSGNMIWDRKGNPMSRGNILGNGWDGSGTQAALILKSLSDPDEYYVFSLDPQEVAGINMLNPKLRYSIVNMTLNNGMGDVKPGAKDIVIDDEMEERMVAVASNDCGYWIVGHKRHSNRYVACKLTESGIQPPVYSAGTYSGDFFGSNPGEIKIAPDKSKIALAFYEDAIIEIGDFNPITGVISNTQILDSNQVERSYGLSFSPDNTKLYAAYGLELNQYDMTLYPNTSAMRARQTNIVKQYNVYQQFGGMRIGPDEKIYLARIFSGYILRINDPNQSGTSCNLDTQSISIPSSVFHWGFGSPTVTIIYKDTVPGRFSDTLVCFSDSVLLNVAPNLLNYTWNDGFKGTSRYVKENGLYYCLSSKGCTMRMDTFKVTFVKGNLDLGADTVICPGDSLVLSVSGDGFQWQDGSTDPSYSITQPGWYSVTANENGCYYADSIKVDVHTPGANILENDTMICKGARVLLHGLSKPGGNLKWNTGLEEAILQVNEDGRYILEATNLCGVFYDSVTVKVQDCDCQPGIPNAFSPNNDGVNDVFKVVLNCFPRSFELSVYNRFGERIYSGYNREEGWDGTYKGLRADLGVYFYDLKYETPNGAALRKKGDLVLVR